MLIYVASVSQYKLTMVTEVVLDLFPVALADLWVKGFDIPSGVEEYPHTADNLDRGARNRMAYLAAYYGDADYCVAQQGGAIEVGHAKYESGVVLVRSRQGITTGALRTGIPISQALENDLKLGRSPMDLVVEQTGKSHAGGYAGYMTDGRISAYQTYRTAVMVAFQAQLRC